MMLLCFPVRILLEFMEAVWYSIRCYWFTNKLIKIIEKLYKLEDTSHKLPIEIVNKVSNIRELFSLKQQYKY